MGGRSCLSTELYTLDNITLENEERELKHYFSRKLTHIDYMLYRIEAGSIESTIANYKITYNIPQLREKLTKELLLYANAKNYRDSDYWKRKRKTDREYNYKGKYEKTYKR